MDKEAEHEAGAEVAFQEEEEETEQMEEIENRKRQNLFG